tara:strand:- start:4840 stop:5034 length:195 start_codon:yes stop_codon:yes gene_type:complete
MPVGLVWWRNDEVARVDRDSSILRGPYARFTGYDKKQLPSGVMVPIGHRSGVEMDQSCVRFLLV